LEEGGASEARGERLPVGSEVEAARLRSGPGRWSVSAMSSKSSPDEAAEDSVELRAGSSNMVTGMWSVDWLWSRRAVSPLSVVGEAGAVTCEPGGAAAGGTMPGGGAEAEALEEVGGGRPEAEAPEEVGGGRPEEVVNGRGGGGRRQRRHMRWLIGGVCVVVRPPVNRSSGFNPRATARRGRRRTH
jgi:hypothetical protein